MLLDGSLLCTKFSLQMKRNDSIEMKDFSMSFITEFIYKTCSND